MRNIVGIKADGSICDIDYPYSLTDLEQVSETFFSFGGELRCIDVLDFVRDVYYDICPDGVDKNLILNAKDRMGIVMIYNEYDATEKPWKYNEFLSKLLTYPVYADDIVIVTTKDEMENICDVTDEYYDRFINEIENIINLCHEVTEKSYLTHINLMCDNDNIISLSYKDAADFQDEYIGKKQECNFIEAIQISDKEFMVSKSGIILLQTGNTGEIYFTQRFTDENGILIDRLC